MTIHKIKMSSGNEWFLSGDFTQASSSLRACFYDPKEIHNWQGTPHQVADAHHNPAKAAGLVYDYFRDRDDDDKVESLSPLANQYGETS
jgi:hypothetical protein